MDNMEIKRNNTTNRAERISGAIADVVRVSGAIILDIIDLGMALKKCRSVQEIQDTLGPPDPR